MYVGSSHPVDLWTGWFVSVLLLLLCGSSCCGCNSRVDGHVGEWSMRVGKSGVRVAHVLLPRHVEGAPLDDGGHVRWRGQWGVQGAVVVGMRGRGLHSAGGRVALARTPSTGRFRMQRSLVRAVLWTTPWFGQVQRSVSSCRVGVTAVGAVVVWCSYDWWQHRGWSGRSGPGGARDPVERNHPRDDHTQRWTLHPSESRVVGERRGWGLGWRLGLVVRGRQREFGRRLYGEGWLAAASRRHGSATVETVSVWHSYKYTKNSPWKKIIAVLLEKFSELILIIL